jgi:hypothetical protein
MYFPWPLVETAFSILTSDVLLKTTLCEEIDENK